MEWIEHFLKSDTHENIARRTALTAYGIRVLSAGIAYLVQILLARWLGVFDYGVYVMVWTWVLILGHMSTLGLSVIPELFIPTYTQQAKPELLRGYTVYSRAMTFISATLIAAGGFACIYFFGGALEQYYIWPLYLALICLPFFAVTETFDGISRCYNAAATAMGPPYILRPLLIVLFMALGHLYGLAPNAQNAMGAALLACIVTALLQHGLVARLLSRNIAIGKASFAPKLWLLAAMPLFFAESARVLLQNIDILVLAKYINPPALALYFAVSKTLALAIFVNFALAAAVSHRFTEYHVSGDQQRLKEFITQTSRWSFGATALAVASLLILGHGFLYLFGSAYTAGYPLLFILSAGVLVRSTIGPADRLLALLGHQMLLAKLVAATLVFATIFLFALVPLYGSYGAACAISAAAVFETILLAFFVHRRLGLNPGFWHYNSSRQPV